MSLIIFKERIHMRMFNCDYLEGAHEKILERMAETNYEQTVGYGEDGHCSAAAELIKEMVGDKDAYVQFLVGGTQTNMTILSYLLRPHEGVISADTGHIAVHESGAIEAQGHKVITLKSEDGKLSAKDIKAFVKTYWANETADHMVKPRAVYISYATETGSLYTKEELRDIRKVCKKYDMYLFLDGARLGYGLMSEKSDLTIRDIYELTDVFYIGGTKQGALFGEAVVFNSGICHKEFRYYIKQKGGMLAKGRLLGIQFETLLEKDVHGDCLYFRLARHADELAMKLKKGISELGFELYSDSYTNQQFFILPDKLIKKLSRKYSFSTWAPMGDGRTAVRICTSWATKEEAVDALIEDMAKAASKLGIK